jgi:hypothetical protein
MGRFWARTGRKGIRKGSLWITNKRFLEKKPESAETGKGMEKKGRSWMRSGALGIRRNIQY